MNKVLKIILIVILALLIIMGVIFAVDYFRENNLETPVFSTGITTALSLEDEIKTDIIWCGTFQLIWNDLKNLQYS